MLSDYEVSASQAQFLVTKFTVGGSVGIAGFYRLIGSLHRLWQASGRFKNQGRFPIKGQTPYSNRLSRPAIHNISPSLPIWSR